MYEIFYSCTARADAKKLYKSHLKEKCIILLETIKHNPYQNPPPYEKLCGDLDGCYSRRINSQHRLVYEVDEISKTVKIYRMWTHYE